MALHEILLTSHFVVLCRRQRILKFHIQFLPKNSSEVCGLAGSPWPTWSHGFPNEIRRKLWLLVLSGFFFLRRDLSGRVSPPFASPLGPQLSGSKQTTSSCAESPELVFVLARLGIEAERKVPICKRYLYIITVKNWYILITSREGRTWFGFFWSFPAPLVTDD